MKKIIIEISNEQLLGSCEEIVIKIDNTAKEHNSQIYFSHYIQEQIENWRVYFAQEVRPLCKRPVHIQLLYAGHVICRYSPPKALRPYIRLSHLSPTEDWQYHKDKMGTSDAGDRRTLSGRLITLSVAYPHIRVASTTKD